MTTILAIIGLGLIIYFISSFKWEILIVLGIIIAIKIVAEFLFYLTHRRPLTDEEIKKLMQKRRRRYINRTFSFKTSGAVPNREFKSMMNPSGEMYSIDMDVSGFPNYVANLLKYKKHEWHVFACASDNLVKYFYVNKGEDNKSVTPNISISELILFCKQKGFQTILSFHNHPNGDPAHHNYLRPSSQDLKSARYETDLSLSSEINFLSFVCERGRFLEYSRSFSESYLPPEAKYDVIAKQNENSTNHYRLQRELGMFR